MNWKAVGIDTGKVYATGTKADCVRMINERISNHNWDRDGTRSDATITHKEAIRVMPEGQRIPTSEDEEKEIELLRIRFKQAAMMERRQAEAEKMERERARKERIEAFYGTRAEREAERLRKFQEKIERNERTRWKEEETTYLIANYKKLTRNEMAKHLGKSRGVVDSKLSKLFKEGRIKRSTRTWTKEEDDFVIKNYKTLKPKEIAKELGIDAVKVRAHIAVLKYAGKL